VLVVAPGVLDGPGMTMTSRRLLSSFATCFALALSACAGDDVVTSSDPPSDTSTALPYDVAAAIAQLPDANVQRSTADGVPLQLGGDLGQIAALRSTDPAAVEAALRPHLPALLAPFRLQASAVALRKARRDDRGAYHLRFAQRHQGKDVVGGDLVIHVDAGGTVYAINGTARGDLSPKLGASSIGTAAALARVDRDPAQVGLAARVVRTVYLITATGTTHQAYEIETTGTRGEDPVRDLVYVDVDTGAIAAVYPQIHAARDRRTHDVQHGTLLPGVLRRTETGAATADIDVDAAHDNVGHTYDAYQQFFGRDSFDGQGAALISTVHYSSGYCNAFWNGTQMVYGDGNGYDCYPLARSVDVTSHELTHAVTAYESALNYGGEPGGINESLSDIFGAFAEAWVDGGRTGTLAITPATWLIADEVMPPFLRDLCDPAADGFSKDEWSSSVGTTDVHYSSGVGNLAFCLLAKGGTHPRGKTQIPVAGIGFDKAIRLAYKAQVDILTSNANYSAYRAAMEQAATELGYDAGVQQSVRDAFAAVKVDAPVPIDPATVPALRNGVTESSIAVALGEPVYRRIEVPAGISTLTVRTWGGTGEIGLFVQRGDKPTASSYLCRPLLEGNNETCTITTPPAGTYYVMLAAGLNGSSVNLTATYFAASGDPYFSGPGLFAMTGAQGSTRYWRIYGGGPRSPVSVTMAGGSGDADLYTRFGSRPTLSEYGCRPYTVGNNESCASTSTAIGDHYIMVRGYKAYADVSLVVSY